MLDNIYQMQLSIISKLQENLQNLSIFNMTFAFSVISRLAEISAEIICVTFSQRDDDVKTCDDD